MPAWEEWEITALLEIYLKLNDVKGNAPIYSRIVT
jgi:hypothetical protein